MKRILSLALAAILMIGVLALPTQAANADSQAGVIKAVSGLNVRTEPTTGSRVLTTLSNGSYVTLISRSGSWWRVEYGGGRYGYCHADYITAVSGNTATVNTDPSGLNVRSGPGTSYARIGGLSQGYRVIVLSTNNGWSRILYQGTKTGYVSAQYLSGNTQAPSAPSGNQAVSLSVPSFKQYDSRWSWVTIGSSGKTMEKIGCATTAIAMMESYRTGTTIYPDAMSKRLNYTSSGSVYWPSHYTTVTSNASYLSVIYNQLKQGKPVLFGAKNSYGTQHWVVITGFTGGSLTAGNFTINDPGSNTRTNLQQFLGAYPTFYKYFYY
ncbi:MAG: SH3 domain-containing protein [Oscillospiraceae bacterium]|nr:SH3 domain-containing protein [Oscillospiraceae bacterium]